MLLYILFTYIQLFQTPCLSLCSERPSSGLPAHGAFLHSTIYAPRYEKDGRRLYLGVSQFLVFERFR